MKNKVIFGVWENCSCTSASTKGFLHYLKKNIVEKGPVSSTYKWAIERRLKWGIAQPPFSFQIVRFISSVGGIIMHFNWELV